jgi:hypothetical protein
VQKRVAAIAFPRPQKVFFDKERRNYLHSASPFSLSRLGAWVFFKTTRVPYLDLMLVKVPFRSVRSAGDKFEIKILHPPHNRQVPDTKLPRFSTLRQQNWPAHVSNNKHDATRAL